MRFLLSVLIAILLPVFALGQGYDKGRGRLKKQDEDDKIRLQITTLGVGFGSFFAEESITFSSEALYGTIQLHGIGFPVIKEGTSTGIALEAHPSKLITAARESNLRLQTISEMDFRVWSITRVPMSAIPLSIFQTGTLSRTFTGGDVLIHEQGSKDFTKGFDARFVLGGDLGVLGPGNFVVEIYALQEDIPIAFSIIYGF